MSTREPEGMMTAAGSSHTPPDEHSLVMEAERFAARCSELIGRIRRTGEEVVITRRGKPVARLLPIPHDATDEAGDDRLVWDLEAIGP